MRATIEEQNRCRNCVNFDEWYDPANPRDQYACVVVNRYVDPDDNCCDYFNIPAYQVPDGAYIPLKNVLDEDGDRPDQSVDAIIERLGV